VRLLSPPPLEVDLDLVVEGPSARLSGSAAPVAEGATVSADTLADATVEPVGPDQGRAAEAQYKGLADHPFPGCFVCGPDNAEGLRLRPGPLGDGRTACTWNPAADLAAGDGLVEPVFLWAALDCPGGWSIDLEGRPSVLGQMSASIDARPAAGEPCVVMGRLLSEDGRKTHTASTLYDADGRVLARARHTWILVDPALFN
jgi:acyl-coenzyme A thioesterase PaaI-like protein